MTIEQWTPYNNRTIWALMTQEEKYEFMNCEGELLFFAAYSHRNGFTEISSDIGSLDEFPVAVFRREKPAPTKPDVDWSALIDSIVYVARDKRFNFYGYEFKPTQLSEYEEFWDAPARGKVYCLGALKSISPGTCDWKDSLIVRPGHEGVTE